MGLDELKREIIEQAQREAAALTEQARKEAGEIERATTTQAESERAVAAQETTRMVDELQQRELASAALEAKKRAMAQKKAVLDEAFVSARELLLKLPTAERKAFLQGLMRVAGSEISVETIFCNARDKDLLSGKVQSADILGGIIAETKDGSVRVDYSYETLLAEVNERYFEEIGRIVFKN